MKNLKTFESFLLPKPVRGMVWDNEKLSLAILKRLKSIDFNDKEELSKLNITTENLQYGRVSVYNFYLGLPYKLVYSTSFDNSGEYFFTQGNYKLDVSKEVCKQIRKQLVRLLP